MPGHAILQCGYRRDCSEGWLSEFTLTLCLGEGVQTLCKPSTSPPPSEQEAALRGVSRGAGRGAPVGEVPVGRLSIHKAGPAAATAGSPTLLELPRKLPGQAWGVRKQRTSQTLARASRASQVSEGRVQHKSMDRSGGWRVSWGYA